MFLFFCGAIACALVDLDSCAVDHICPLRDSSLEHFSDVFGRTNPWGHAGTQQLLLNRFVVERTFDLDVEPIDEASKSPIPVSFTVGMPGKSLDR